eukprot:3493021-Rhodomonas_salina.2
MLGQYRKRPLTVPDTPYRADMCYVSTGQYRTWRRWGVGCYLRIRLNSSSPSSRIRFRPW